MDDKSWTVVHFEKDNTVEAVPSAWIIDNEKCLWPPATWTAEKVLNAIKNCHTDTHWQDFAVKTFRNAIYSNYEKARNKAKKAESDSDLSTTDVEQGKRKRRRPKINYSSDDDDEDNNLLSFVKEPPQYNSKAKHKRSLLREAYKSTSTPKSTPKQTKFFSPYNEAEEPGEGGSKELEQDAYELNTNNARADPKGSLETLDKKTNKAQLNHQNGLPCNCGRCCPYQTKMLNQILKEQIKMKEVLKDIAQNNANHTEKITSPLTKQSTFGDFQLPINKDGDLQNFNEFLKDKNNLEKSIRELSRIGGSDNNDFVKRCLAFLVSSQLACKYSWLGRRKKAGFKENYGQIVSLIVESAENTKKAKDRKESEELIKAWFRRAAERNRRSHGEAPEHVDVPA